MMMVMMEGITIIIKVCPNLKLHSFSYNVALKLI